MPVREALRELEGEGVLDVFPHRGAVIRGVDRRFIRNLYDVRGAIEGMLAGGCAERIEADALGPSLGRAADLFESAGARAEDRVAANSGFHAILNSGCGQSRGASRA